MKWKNRLTNYNFWISLISAILLILQAFNFEFNIAYVSEIATAVLGLLVVIGIISDPTKVAVDATAKSAKKEEPKEEKIEKPLNAEEIKEKAEDFVTPNISADENSICSNESDIQIVIDHITKEIENATEKLKAENKEIANEIVEITSKVEKLNTSLDSMQDEKETSATEEVKPEEENTKPEIQPNSLVYNIVN